MIPTRTRGSDPSSEVEESTHYVLGDDHIGIAIAERLQAGGHRVAVVNEAYEPGDVPGFVGDPADVDVLSDAGVGSASTVIVTTCSDRRNFLVAQLVRARFDVPRIIVFVDDPDRVPLFEAAGHEPFCATTALSEALGEIV